MSRTDVSTVEETIDTSLAENEIKEWIEIATTLVDDIATEDPSVSSTRLTQIETLLAQHLLSTQDQRASSESGPVLSRDYQGETGMGLDGTKYGQQAMILDPTGTLRQSHGVAIDFDVVDVT